MKILAVLVICATLISNSLAAEEQARHRTSLFDGKTLNGWTLENSCEADVVDGCLRLRSGLGWLRHDLRLRDFDLHVEWKTLQAGNYDSGIFFRCERDASPFPRTGYQVNLLEGKEGDVPGVSGAESRGLAKPAGEWNVFDLHVLDETAALEINGQTAWKVSGLERLDGWIGFQIEVPNGGQFLLKNIVVSEIGYSSLFNGHDLAGWESASGSADECWSVREATLVCSGKKGPWLRSVAEYGDFDLRLEYLVNHGGNSGVYVRVPPDGNHHRENAEQPAAGFEVQILDDTAPEHAALKDFQYSASVYDFVGANPRVSRPLGEWNSLEINCRGQHLTTWHNGIQVTNFSPEEAPLLTLRSAKGFLGLQNHNTIVKFRNLRVGPAISVPLTGSK